MWNEPSREKLNDLPRLNETEEIPLQKKLVRLHFFIGSTDFYIIEFDGKKTFWGFVILNGDYEMAEFGYINYEELKSIKVNHMQEIDCDLYWKIRPTNQVEKICMAQAWQLPEPNTDIEIQCPVCTLMINADSECQYVYCENCKTIVLQQQIKPYKRRKYSVI